MKRREFLAAAGAMVFPPGGGTTWAKNGQSAFPVHFRRTAPYEPLFRFVNSGSDAFAGERPAEEWEERLNRMFEGAEPVATGLRSWSGRLDQVRSARFYALPEKRIRFEISLADGKGLTYRTGMWRLPNFEVLEEDIASSPKPLFRDLTANVFGGAESFSRQLLKGNTYWRARLDSAAGIDVYGSQGIAVGDIDNDGSDEVYVCQPGGLPNLLFRFRSDGTAEDITERAGVGLLDDTTCALFADFRNCGKQDLVVLRSSGPLLFENAGGGEFRERPDTFQFKSKPQGSFTGMSAADYDRDGKLDLYLCCYVYFQSEDQYQFPAPYCDARNGPPNFLMKNRLTGEGGGFEDVTEECGLMENNDRFSFAPAWCDFDGDGWPDLYVANDFGRNNLYRNRGGHFRDEAAKAGVEDIGPGMSASWFDYDGDGLPDLYISNMWSAAGQRVTKDAAFKPAAGNEEAYRRHTKGNSLYRNRGDGTFAETGPAERVEMGRWAWGSGGFDFDLDGSPEIFITTGMLTNPSKKDLNSFFWRQTVAKSPSTQRTAPEYENGWSAINQLIRQEYSWCGNEKNVYYARREGKYRDCSGISGLDFAEDSRAFAVTDFDGDGCLDILLKSRMGPQVRSLRNECGTGRPAIAIKLEGTRSNRDAIGARVEVNGSTQWVDAGSGFFSQHTKQLHFGLAGKESAHVKVTWPSGLKQEWQLLEPGFRYGLKEGSQDCARRAFRKRQEYPGAAAPAAENRPEAADSWLLQPVPTPDRRRGPGFLMLYAGTRPAVPAGLPVEEINLSREPEETAASYAVLRRYLFEYRSDLAVPLTMLVDAESRVRKIYASTPNDAAMRADLAQMERSRELALPFPGHYFSEPRRSYFKLGAAFYWAGYAAEALPYLQEAVRYQPENWKAALAIGRIRQERKELHESLDAYRKVLAMHPGYVPAMVNAAEVYAELNDGAAAEKILEEAIALDADSADAANQLGLLAAGRQDYEGARKRFQQAIAAQRDHSGAINNLGVLYTKTGKTNDAIAAFQYGIETAPEDETLSLNLARVYVTSGDRDRAREVLGKLLERKPGSPIAIKALGELESR